jgi:hypothetical protein
MAPVTSPSTKPTSAPDIVGEDMSFQLKKAGDVCFVVGTQERPRTSCPKQKVDRYGNTARAGKL